MCQYLRPHAFDPCCIDGYPQRRVCKCGLSETNKAIHPQRSGSEDRPAMDAINLRARVAAVEAELARREECATAERAAGRVCDYCEDFIPEIRAALSGEDETP